MSIDMQVLKDLKREEEGACGRETAAARSAGARPPRALDYPNDGEGQALALRERGGFSFFLF